MGFFPRLPKLLSALRSPLSALLVLLLLACSPGASQAATATAAPSPLPAQAGDPFERTWQRTDGPVASLFVSRTWMWGPETFTGELTEPYDDAPGGERRVRYFDKSRMEDNTWREPDAPWHVTNGLLVVELMHGRVQTGDGTFVPRRPSIASVAGDPDDDAGPTYATLAVVAGQPPLAEGTPVTWTLARDGAVGTSASAAAHGVTAGPLSPETGHRVASVFWEFMTSTGPVDEGGGIVDAPLFPNPYYATGLPITEAYWATVRVAGQPREVLVQAFERRVLTYTPGNPAGWQVEAGNVGRHYHSWRYGSDDLPRVTIDGSSGPRELYVEVADTMALQGCGLMHRFSLLDNQAMLFAFGSDAPRMFWNRNTEIPLQLAWMSSAGVILGLSDMLAADRESPNYPVSYASPGPVRYVIEANAGWFTANGIGPGDTVDLAGALAHGSQGAVPICEALGYDERT